MRVVFVNRFCFPDHSATSQIVSDLASSLASRGMSVTLVASRQRYDDPSEILAAADRWQNVDIVRIWTTRFGRSSLVGRACDYLSFYISLPFVLMRILRKGDAIVAKTDPPLLSVLVAPIAKAKGALLVNWLQDVFPEVATALGHPRIPDVISRALRWLRNSSLRRSSMTVAIGQAMATYLKSEGVEDEKITVIENWSLEESIRPMPTSQSLLRDRLELGGRFVVGYSGNLGRAHDWESILAAAQALEGDSRIAFLIGGGGQGYALLKAQAEREGLRNIHFQPYHPVEALGDSLAACDLHIVSLLPALEGRIVPSKFYGIAAAGRAIAFLGAHDGELAKIISGADCGFVIDQRRGDSLKTSVLALATDPERCLEQGRRARNLLDSGFSRKRAHDRWHGLLLGLGPTNSRIGRPD